MFLKNHRAEIKGSEKMITFSDPLISDPLIFRFDDLAFSNAVGRGPDHENKCPEDIGLRYQRRYRQQCPPQ